MLEMILKISIIIFGTVAGFVLVLPLMICMFEQHHNYLPFGIGTVLGVAGAFVLAYALRFHG